MSKQHVRVFLAGKIKHEGVIRVDLATAIETASNVNVSGERWPAEWCVPVYTVIHETPEQTALNCYYEEQPDMWSDPVAWRAWWKKGGH